MELASSTDRVLEERFLVAKHEDGIRDHEARRGMLGKRHRLILQQGIDEGVNINFGSSVSPFVLKISTHLHQSSENENILTRIA